MAQIAVPAGSGLAAAAGMPAAAICEGHDLRLTCQGLATRRVPWGDDLVRALRGR